MPCYVHACAGPGRAKHCPLALGAAFWAAPVQARMIASGITAGPVPSRGWEATSPLHSSYYRVSFPTVRVPALSVGAGEGNPSAYSCRHSVPKPNGIQVIYGKQEPTHNWSRYVKRSFKRACHRAIKHGQASYKGLLGLVGVDTEVLWTILMRGGLLFLSLSLSLSLFVWLGCPSSTARRARASSARLRSGGVVHLRGILIGWLW